MKAATFTTENGLYSLIISIHAAREGGDYLHCIQPIAQKIFQSTPPVKAATRDVGIYCRIEGISIHAAREGGDKIKQVAVFAVLISIHAAREGGDVSHARSSA